MPAITSANVANAIVKLVAADALPALVGSLIMGNLVNRDYEPVLANAGDTVNVPLPHHPRHPLRSRPPLRGSHGGDRALRRAGRRRCAPGGAVCAAGDRGAGGVLVGRLLAGADGARDAVADVVGRCRVEVPLAIAVPRGLVAVVLRFLGARFALGEDGSSDARIDLVRDLPQRVPFFFAVAVGVKRERDLSDPVGRAIHVPRAPFPLPPRRILGGASRGCSACSTAAPARGTIPRMTPRPSTAYATSQVLLSTQGLAYGCACTIATPGRYYLIFLDATSAPSSGDVTGGAAGAYLWCSPYTTTIADQIVDVDFTVGGGLVSASGLHPKTGLVAFLSSTVPTAITPVAASIWCNGRLG